MQAEFSMMAVGGSKANAAYLERLSKAAAEAAAKGYGVRRATRTVRRTRVQKTTNTTDLRTMDTETSTEETTHVDEWTKEESPDLIGVGVVVARRRRVVEKYSDGSEDVVDQSVKGQANFWLGGDTASACNKRTYEWSSGLEGDHTNWVPCISSC